jgi:tetratricopeptide (TPR) repeat protein
VGSSSFFRHCATPHPIAWTPNDAQMRSPLSGFLINTGRTDEAIEWASRALAQPHSSAFAKYYKLNLAGALYFAGRYQEALDTVKGSETILPDTAAAIYMRAGHIEEARKIIADWLKTGHNHYSVALESCFPVKEPMMTAFLDDLRKAGLPEK